MTAAAPEAPALTLDVMAERLTECLPAVTRITRSIITYVLTGIVSAGPERDAALVAILSRIASPDQAAEIAWERGEARTAALNEAAAWHEAQILPGHCGEENDEARVRQRHNEHHRRSAAGIRALTKSEADHD